MTDFRAIAEHIGRASGRSFNPTDPGRVGGGCINTAVQLSDGHSQWFVKLNRAGLADMFDAEFTALDELAATHTIRVPRPLCTGTVDGASYIVMEYLHLGQAGATGQAWAGERLAALHRHTAERFGWSRDNTIGATLQPNEQQTDWIAFWRDQRLGFQLELAAGNGHGGRLQQLGDRLLGDLDALIDHAPAPSLLHGDLWGGNIGYDTQGEPVIYDPASYYGDREADIAMTELFGGFGSDFYHAYRNAWPLDPGYDTRKTLYNLYHVLNHLNLFGGGYGRQAEGMMERLLAQI